MLEKIKVVLKEVAEVNPEDVTLEADLREDLGIDSLSAIELGTELESEFGIEIADEELVALKTVEDIIKLIESK